MRSRSFFAAAIVLTMLAAACSNTSTGKAAPTTADTGKTSNTTANAQDLTKKVPRPGVSGVTDSEIRVAVITAKTNPLGGKYHEYIDGIKAYFKTINDKGGIYGRQLT